MNAEQVVEKILSDAQAEADKILGNAKSRSDALQSELDGKIQNYNKETQELVEKAAQEKHERMMANARMDVQKETLARKCALLDEVFDKAVKRLEELEDKDYLALIESLLTKAVETGNEEVVVGKNENRIDAAFIKQVNRQLGPGFKGNLQMSNDKADISGGFILRRGKVRINVSTNVLVKQVREELEMELASELFE